MARAARVGAAQVGGRPTNTLAQHGGFKRIRRLAQERTRERD